MHEPNLFTKKHIRVYILTILSYSPMPCPTLKYVYEADAGCYASFARHS